MHVRTPANINSLLYFQEPVSPAVHVVDASRDLPATLEFRESGEDAFFAVVISEVNGSAVNFKLAPTFTLYMCCRYRLSPKFRPDFPANKRREKVTMTANKVANMMWQTVKVSVDKQNARIFLFCNLCSSQCSVPTLKVSDRTRTLFCRKVQMFGGRNSSINVVHFVPHSDTAY